VECFIVKEFVAFKFLIKQTVCCTPSAIYRPVLKANAKSQQYPFFDASVLYEHCCSPQNRLDKISYLVFIVKISQRILISAKREQK